MTAIVKRLSIIAAILTFLATPDPQGLWAQASSRDNPSVLKPFSARFNGNIYRVGGISDVIRGHTIVLTQPWVSRNKSQLREFVIFFGGNGQASSKEGGDLRYNVRGYDICLSSKSFANCYTPYQDSTQQAYLSDNKANLLSRVTRIEVGDSRGLVAAHNARLRKQAEAAAAQAAFLGLLFEAMFMSEPSGSSGPYGTDYYNEMFSNARSSGAPGWRNDQD